MWLLKHAYDCFETQASSRIYYKLGLGKDSLPPIILIMGYYSV